MEQLKVRLTAHLGLVEHGEVVHVLGHMRVVFTVGLFVDGERLLVKRLGLSIFALYKT